MDPFLDHRGFFHLGPQTGPVGLVGEARHSSKVLSRHGSKLGSRTKGVGVGVGEALTGCVQAYASHKGVRSMEVWGAQNIQSLRNEKPPLCDSWWIYMTYMKCLGMAFGTTATIWNETNDTT